MKTDKLKVYLLELILIAFLFFILFAPNIVSKLLMAIILIIYYIISLIFLKRKNKKSMLEAKTLILMIIFGIIYISIFYAIGLYTGYENNKYLFNLDNILKIYIPITLIIVVSELIRKKYISQDTILDISGKKINLSLFFIFLMTILIDLSIYSGVYDLDNLEDFLQVVGFVFFSSFSCNLFFNYLSSRYGAKGIIAFRLLTTLPLYVLPIVPKLYILMRIFLRILVPLILYFLFEVIFSKENLAVGTESRRNNFIATIIVFIILTLFIMLISCQFKYGIIVIGSQSMTGTIDKGDAIIYEEYKEQHLNKGDIIIFDYNGIKTVHRIKEVRTIDGKSVFITKGDANKLADDGFRTSKDVSGIVKLKIKYLGLPTIWLRSLFN